MLKALTFEERNRVPRDYVATREGEPVRMGANSQSTVVLSIH
jgi:hypothetical protein